MILDLKKIARNGKTSENFFLEYTPKENLCDIPNVTLISPVKVNGTVTLTSQHSCYIEGEVCFTLKGECTTCLTETTREYITEISEDVDGKEDSYPIVNDTVDLTKIVDDAILINMPLNFLCKDHESL